MLSDGTIRQRLEDGDITIENLEDLDNQLQPSGVDLRLGADYKHPASENVFSVNPGRHPEAALVFEPHTFYLIHTKESLTLPDDLAGRIEGRNTFARKGLRFTAGKVEPGWNGVLTIGVYNQSESEIQIPPGERVVQLEFIELDSPAETSYDEQDESQYQDQTGVTDSKY